MKTYILLILVASVLAGRLRNRLKSRTRVRSRATAKQVEFAQMVPTRNDGKSKCKWGDLQRRITKYPKIVKDHYKASGSMCDLDNAAEPVCHNMTAVLDLAAQMACEYPTITEDDAVYYVNTRRLENEDVFSVYKNYLNQFTFAILPSKKDAVDDENYNIRVFSVVIPADKSNGASLKPYVDEVCPFDFSMDYELDDTTKIPKYLVNINKDKGLKQGDLKAITEDLRRKNCFYNIAKDTKVIMKFHETEDFKKFTKMKNELEAGRGE